MKELSIEEKARNYDEAYKKVAIRFGSNVADEIFLKESEDERIRKCLVNYFREVCDNVAEKEKNAVLAWLEKQSRLMKALQISNSKIGDLIEENYYLRENLKKQGKNDMGISEATKQKLEDNLNKALEKETPESLNEFLEKQDEHKCDCKYVGCHVNNMKRWCHKKQSEILYEKCGTKCSEYLKQDEQKPAAWSEEDDEILYSIINDIEIRSGRITLAELKESYTKQIDWLKSLKDRVLPQPKQEWSEEDERNLYYWLDNNKSIGNDKYRWLLSLKERCTWKPSDEQMQQLNIVSTGKGYFDKRPLREMYEQLKKLK